MKLSVCDDSSLKDCISLVDFYNFLGENIRWTNWGLVSGFLWVLGGSVGIHAIRTAGMAIATGTWASVTVMMNFIWGILIFHEPVQSFTSTCCAFVLLGIGLIGMSRYSDPSFSLAVNNNNNSGNNNSNSTGMKDTSNTTSSDEHFELTTSNHNSHDEEEAKSASVASSTAKPDRKKAVRKRLLDETALTTTSTEEGGETIKSDDGKLTLPLIQQRQDPKALANKDRIVLFGRWALTRRQLGICSAVANGVLAGSSLIPLHYAKKKGFGGATYMISFSIGSLIANSVVWSWYYAYTYITLEQQRTVNFSSMTANNNSNSGGNSNSNIINNMRWYAAWEALPKWHFAQLWLPGFMAGLLLSIGMFGSITTVTFLGQGIGNSLIQSKILISGLWGICWYKEITSRNAIFKWFLSASIAVTGILWLTLERKAAPAKSSIT